MRKVLIISLILSSFLLLTSFAIKKTENTNDEWYRTYQIVDDFVKVFHKQNEYVLLGNKNNEIHIILIDKNGEIVRDIKPSIQNAYALSMVEMEDGYVVAGYILTHGIDMFIAKINDSGNIEWQRVFGGDSDDWGVDVIRDGEYYILLGETASFGEGWDDAWLVKVDKNGNEVWNKTYGGKGMDDVYKIVDLPDGYAFAGYTSSYGNGKWDAWLVKVDKNGNEVWNKTYGGKGMDDVRALSATIDGGFILAGATMSYGEGGSDVFIIKTDTTGNVEWEQTFGWYDFEGGEAIAETKDGYVIAGATISTGAGDFDGLLLKVDKNGNVMWYKTFGREDRDGFSDMIYENGSFILAGEITVNYNPHKEAGWIVRCNDIFPPEMGIIKPENGIYINDRKIIPFPQTVAIGKISIEAEINRTIDEMDCYIDGDLNKTFYSPPFMVEIDKKGIAWHNIKFVAYYGNAGENRAVRKRIFMINPFPAPASAASLHI